MIRQAQQHDAHWLLDLTERFNDKFYHKPLNRDKALTTIRSMIASPQCVVLRSSGGYIAGVIEDDPFRDWTFLCERGWYSEDRSGIKLLDAFIQEGRDNPFINEVRLCNLATNPGVQKLLARRGFTVREVSSGLLT